MNEQTERHEKYIAVNSQWPDIVPELTSQEALAAAKKLYRFAMKKPFKGKWKLTSGNRYSYIRYGTFYVNPKRDGWGVVNGWHDLVHMISHVCHRLQHPTAKPHDHRHHFLEKEMVAYVIAQGWLTGKLRKRERAAKPAADPLAPILARIKRWETKQKRAETALRKLRRKATYYERKAAA